MEWVNPETRKENWEGGRGEYLLKTYCVLWNILLSLFMRRRSESQFLTSFWSHRARKSARYASIQLDIFFPVWVELFHEKIRNLKLAVSWWSERKAGDVWIWHWEGKYLTFFQSDAQICLLCCYRQGHHPCPATALGLSLVQYFPGSMVVYVFFWSSPLPGMCSL